KRLTTVRPRSVGSFLIGRSASWASSSAVSRMSSASDRLRSAAEIRWRFTVLPPLVADGHAVLPVYLVQEDVHDLALGGRQVLSHVVGPDRELAMAAVDQDRELDRPRAAEVVQRVESGADRTARVQHVVDQDD